MVLDDRGAGTVEGGWEVGMGVLLSEELARLRAALADPQHKFTHSDVAYLVDVIGVLQGLVARAQKAALRGQAK